MEKAINLRFKFGSSFGGYIAKDLSWEKRILNAMFPRVLILVVVCLGQVTVSFGQKNYFPDSLKMYLVNVDGTWDQAYFGLRYKYDSMGQLSELRTLWYGELLSLETFEYRNAKISKKDYFLVRDDTFLIYRREEHYFDEKGRDTFSVFYDADNAAGQLTWDRNVRSIYTEDSLEREVQIINEHIWSGVPGFYRRDLWENTYEEGSMNPDTSTFYSAENQTGSPAWKPKYRTIRKGWSQGFFPNYLEYVPTYVSFEYYIVDQFYMQKVDTLRNHGSGESRRYIFSVNNDGSNYLENIETLIYDQKGNRLLKDIQVFKPDGSPGVPYSEEFEYIYNPNGSISIVKKIERHENEDITLRTEYYYQGKLSSVNEELQQSNIYPNPVRSGKKIYLPEEDWDDIILFSMEGKQIPVGLDKLENAVQLPELLPGVYLIKCRTVHGKVSQAKIQIIH